MTFHDLAPLGTAAVTLVGLGVLWGALKSQVSSLKDEVDRMAENLDRQETLLTELREEVRVRFAAQQAAKASTTRARRKR